MAMADAGDHRMDSLAAYMQGHLSLADYEWPEPHRSSLAANGSHQHFLIPEIDMQSLLRPRRDGDHRKFYQNNDANADRSGLDNKRTPELAALLDAAVNCGFFQVYNHGIPVSAFETLHSFAKKFFSRPLEQKLEVEKSLGNLFEELRFHTGYSCGSPLDSPVKWWIESLLVAAYDKRNVAAVTECLCIDDDERTSFVDALESCSLGFTKLARQLSSILLQELGVDAETLLKEFVDGEEESVVVKFNHYPACPQPEKTGGLPAHTDVSLVTVLWQDAVGGLQVQRDGHWMNVKPRRDCIVVNIGDVFQIWSNDRFKSGMHRALLNTDESRLSIGCFYNTRSSCILGPLPQLLKHSGEHTKFKSIVTSEYKSTVYQGILKDKWQGVEYLRC